AVMEHEPETHQVGIVVAESSRVLYETLTLRDRIVLNVPAALALSGEEARPSLPEHLALAVSSAPDRIVPEDEPEREHSPAREQGFVSAGGGEVDRGVRLLPAFDLGFVPDIARLIERERPSQILARLETVVSRTGVQELEVDRVVSETVHLVD